MSLITNPLVSIIVPVYNVERYVAKCIDSIIAQTYAHFECIIVNDGSTDSSRHICSQFAEIDNRVVILDKVNGGLSSARNHGINNAKGNYLSFVDGDDWLAPTMLETLIKYASDYQADIVVCGHFIVNDESIEQIRNDGKIEVLSKEIALNLILEDKEINSFAWDKLYKAKAIENIRYPLGRIYEDTATTYKIFYNSDIIVKVNIPLYYYLRRRGSICLSSNPLRVYHNFLAFFERYEFAKENRLNSKSICLGNAITQAVCVIDNYAIASVKDVNKLPMVVITEKIKKLYHENCGSIKRTYRFKLLVFILNPILYRLLYKLFYFIKFIFLQKYFLTR